MNLKDTFTDIKLQASNNRTVWLIGGLVAFIVVVMVLVTPGGKGGYSRPVTPASDGEGLRLSADSVYKDLITSFQNDMEDIKQDTRAYQADFARLKSDFEQHQQYASGIFEKVVEKIEVLADEVAKVKEGQSVVAVDGPGSDSDLGGPLEPDGLEAVYFNEVIVPPPPPEPAPRPKITFLSPGDAVPVRLLTGVNAPVDGTPYPVVFGLASAIHGPDGSTLDMGEARLIAGAQGSEVDGRALFRLNQLALRRPDGRRVVVQVDGWIVGEDGIRGMRGKLIDKLGNLIAATATTSFANAFTQAQFEENVYYREGSRNSPINDDTPLALESGIATGLNDTTSKLVDVIIERYEKLVPVVEVLSGREAVAVFSRAVEISPCDDEECETEVLYASLD